MAASDNSIGGRISNLVMLSTAMAMGIVTLILGAYQIQNSVAARRAELIATSYIYASAVAADLAASNKVNIEQIFHSTSRLHDVVGVYALTRAGDVLVSSGNDVFLTSTMTSGEPGMMEMLTRGLMPVGVDVVRGGERVGRLIMVGDITMIRGQLLNSLLATLLAGIAALLVARLSSLRLQRKITAPIVKLTQTMTELTQARRYEPTDIPDAEDETKALVASFNDMISDIRERDAAMQKLAYFDALTGLPNRSHFLEALDSRFNKSTAATGFAVFLIDLDNFETFNETLGQDSADFLLSKVALRLQQAAQQGQFIARLAADEFGVISPDVTGLEAAQMALAPFIAALYAPIVILGQPIHVIANAGIAVAGEYAETSSNLLRQASLALSEAKAQGPGRIANYFPELAERIEEEARIERDLRNVIAAGELDLHYQPIVSCRDARVQGFEALLRWRKGEDVFIAPSKFIPVAEKAGLIAKLGEWALRRACRDAAQWINAGHRPRFVSVNISPSQILQSDFMANVRSALADSGLAPQLLCLELTESLFIGRSINLVHNLLEEARGLGVLTALDDFGTGYSSLSYLENLPFDKLKIDRSFVHQKTPGSKSRSLLKGIVDLAHALKIEIIAEGVERHEEVQLLSTLGAQNLQGFYFARALPAQEALAAAARIEALKVPLHRSSK